MSKRMMSRKVLGSLAPILAAFVAVSTRALLAILGAAVVLTALLGASRPAAAQFPEVAGWPYVGPPAFSQRSNDHKNDRLGTGNLTIGSHGCAITALSSMLSWYGQWHTPRDLNNKLKANGGYANRDEVKWEVAARMAPNVQYLGRNDWKTVSADLNVVNGEIDAGYVAVAEVRMSGQMHFVLLIGRKSDSSNYFIIDPWTGERTTLCPRFGRNPKAALYGIRKYRLTDVAANGDLYAGWHRRVFIDAFYRGGGRQTFQTAQNQPHWWGDIILQDFSLNGSGQRTLVDSGSGVFPVYGGIGATWFGWGAKWGPIGVPRSDEFDPNPSFRGTRGRAQHYSNGAIIWSGYGAHPVVGNIWRQYDAARGTGGSYGFPTGSPWDWNGGKRQDFEGGYIWVRSN